MFEEILARKPANPIIPSRNPQTCRLKARFACLGFPHYIVTVKNANPFDWREIIRVLRQGERQILVVQYLFKYLFKGKKEVKKEGASIVSMDCVVEYQKRGLPHLHIFLWVAKKQKHNLLLG